MKKKWIKFGSIGLAIAVIATMLFTLAPDDRVSISGEGKLSIEAHIALAAQSGGTMGNGSPIPQEIVSPTFARGGPPIVSVAYNFSATGTQPALDIVCSDGLPEIIVTGADFQLQPDEKTIMDVQLRILAAVRRNFQVWILLSSLSADDPCRNGILLDNESIVREKGKDYLVITLCYFVININSLSPLNFITQIRGLDAGPGSGVITE
jgi:hypothetical protein